jgi:hypothetical protein
MKYVLQHKEYRTYYCFDKEDKYKYYSLQRQKAYRFNRESSASKIQSKFKHPDRWEIVRVKDAMQ